MDYKRLMLYIAISFVAMTLWANWQKEVVQPQTKAKISQVSGSNSGHSTPEQSNNFTPPSFGATAAKGASPSAPPAPSSKKTAAGLESGFITVSTDVLHLKIGLRGGNLVSSQLLKYPKSLKDSNIPITILSSEPKQLYQAQTGLTPGKPMVFTTPKSHFVLEKGQKKLVVALTAMNDGLKYVKTFTFYPGKYAINLSQGVNNTTSKTWKGSFYNQIVRAKPDKKYSVFSRGSVNGGAISSPQTPYQKLSYKEMQASNLSRVIKNGWVAMQQHYFLSAWIPTKGTSNQYYSNFNGSLYTLGFVSPAVNIKPGDSVTHQSVFYVGPEIEKNLKSLAPGLDLTINYGWLSPISSVIFTIMSLIHGLVGNWGWSIILVTLLIKVALYYPSSISYKSMSKMRSVAPRIQLLRERYQDDKQALSRATMELYKKEKINPMGGCLPMLVQFPIFIALYYVLMESVQLRMSPFIFWVHDLSVMDPYYILPVIMGASMFLQQRLSPAPPDPAQAKMMMFLPLVFTIMFIHFPAGLVLYWITNNLVSMGQQFYVMKTFDEKAERFKKKKG